MYPVFCVEGKTSARARFHSGRAGCHISREGETTSGPTPHSVRVFGGPSEKQRRKFHAMAPTKKTEDKKVSKTKEQKTSEDRAQGSVPDYHLNPFPCDGSIADRLRWQKSYWAAIAGARTAQATVRRLPFVHKGNLVDRLRWQKATHDAMEAASASQTNPGQRQVMMPSRTNATVNLTK